MSFLEWLHARAGHILWKRRQSVARRKPGGGSAHTIELTTGAVPHAIVQPLEFALAIQMGSDTSLLLYFFTHGEAAASGGRTRPGEICPRRVPSEGTERRRSNARPSRLLALGATTAIFDGTDRHP